MNKNLEIPIIIKYREDENCIYQDFIFITKKSNFKYLKENKFLLHSSLMERIQDHSLVSDGLIMLDMINDDDKITIKYEKKDFANNNKHGCFVVYGSIPDKTGCCCCKYKVDKGSYLLCSFQDNKVYTQELKKCRYFSQKE